MSFSDRRPPPTRRIRPDIGAPSNSRRPRWRCCQLDRRRLETAFMLGCWSCDGHGSGHASPARERGVAGGTIFRTALSSCLSRGTASSSALSSQASASPRNCSRSANARVADPAENPNSPARWPDLNRNGGRLHLGTVADIKSEPPAGFHRNPHVDGPRRSLPRRTAGSLPASSRAPRIAYEKPAARAHINKARVRVASIGGGQVDVAPRCLIAGVSDHPGTKPWSIGAVRFPGCTETGSCPAITPPIRAG